MRPYIQKDKRTAPSALLCVRAPVERTIKKPKAHERLRLFPAASRPPLYGLLQLDLDVYTCWQVQLHQRVNGLVRWVDDIHQALVRTDFELVARSLVHVRRTQDVKTL